ncbi:MAG TPA: putative LPS assembly protein LptD [Thermoanaerobaculia bacterium]|nr:putative LPS assembly protein LptD [Thermoanaerobaculia bacterium]
MTTTACRQTLALTLLFLAATSLFAQGKDMGPAGQYYRQNPRFKFAPSTAKKDGTVRWTLAPQGHIEMEKDEYAVLENDVKVYYQDVVLRADKVTINLKTKDAVAEGHVILDQGPTRLTGDHAVFNLDSRLGTFFKATGSLEPTLYFMGDKLEKTGDDTYYLENGILTSCDIDKPAWSFHVKSAVITRDDYAHMRDLSFRTRDVPIFWTPRLIWPTKSDRSQGFLIPRVGFSNRLGQRLSLAYFIPMGDSADTTLYADLNTKGYNGAGFNMRYLPSSDVKTGELDAYAVHDPVAKKEQWKYQYKHAQDNLPGGFRGVVDIQDYSNLDFFRLWDRDPLLHTLSNIYSSAYLTRNRGTYSINILADRRDILLGLSNPADPTSPTLKQRFEQLPTLQFRIYPERLADTPVYFSMESSASHLRTSGLINGPSADYYRADVFPTLSMQIRTPAWFSIKPQISARETYYSSSLDPAAVANPALPQDAVTQSLTRFYGQGQVELVGPSFSRIFNMNLGGFTKFKHVIEPRIRYIYTTNVIGEDRIIRFDTIDSPTLPIVRDSVEYSLTQRLIGKESGPNPSAREILSFSLRQTVSLSKPFTNATGGNQIGSTIPIDSNQKFTPILASLHYNPYQSISLDANATVSNVSNQLQQASLSANLIGTGKRSDKYLSFSWFSTYNQPNQTFDTSASQFRVNTGTSLWHDKLRADAQINFDAKKGTFLEERYLVGATGSCYGIAVEFRRYLVYDPFPRPITNYALAITLKNVGTISTH